MARLLSEELMADVSAGRRRSQARADLLTRLHARRNPVLTTRIAVRRLRDRGLPVMTHGDQITRGGRCEAAARVFCVRTTEYCVLSVFPGRP